MKKYELTNETKKVNHITLFRIRALKDFGSVKQGDLGGWIEKEANLSQEGYSWISDDACIYDNAEIYDYALVYGNAQISDCACVSCYARVFGNAHIYGNAWVSGSAAVYGNARVYGMARITKKSICTKTPIVLYSSREIIITVTDNVINIGDYSLTLEEWFKYYEQIGRKDSQLKEEIEMYGNALKYIESIKNYEKRWSS